MNKVLFNILLVFTCVMETANNVFSLHCDMAHNMKKKHNFLHVYNLGSKAWF
jgi:hypothetical protein